MKSFQIWFGLGIFENEIIFKPVRKKFPYRNEKVFKPIWNENNSLGELILYEFLPYIHATHHRAFFFIVYGDLFIYIYFLIHFLFPNAHWRLSLKASFLRRSFEGQQIRCKQILFNNRIQCHSFHLGQMPPDFSYPSNSIMAVDSSRSYFQLLPECVDCYRRLF